MIPVPLLVVGASALAAHFLRKKSSYVEPPPAPPPAAAHLADTLAAGAVPTPDDAAEFGSWRVDRGLFQGDLTTAQQLGGVDVLEWALRHGARGDTSGHTFREDGWLVDSRMGSIVRAGSGPPGVAWTPSGP
jgi:hypothetical protein